MSGFKNNAVIGPVYVLLLAAVGFIVLLGGTGCDTTSLGGWDLFDPSSIIQSVYDYRTDVYDDAFDAWDDYIRM